MTTALMALLTLAGALALWLLHRWVWGWLG